MTRTLVLTVDRDNDLGVKTSIRGPVVGRRDVLAAALKLGMADPEESDTNAILGALSQHDAINESKEKDDLVEVAILTGDQNVGMRSDRAVAAQLEEVVGNFQPDQAILVTDGAEDESVLPIIQSQVRISHIEKIIVKQSKGIEGTYYYIVKALEDEKWRSKVMIPFGLIIAILGFGIMLPNEIGGIVIGALPLLTGLFLLAKGAGVESSVQKVIGEMRDNTDAAMVSSIFWGVSVFSVFFAVAEGWRTYSNDIALNLDNSIVYIDTFQASLMWIVIAFLSTTIGFTLLRIKRGAFSGRVVILSIFGMLIYSFFDTSLDISRTVVEGSFTFSPAAILNEIAAPVIWFIVLWGAILLKNSLKERQTQTERYWGI